MTENNLDEDHMAESRMKLNITILNIHWGKTISQEAYQYNRIPNSQITLYQLQLASTCFSGYIFYHVT